MNKFSKIVEDIENKKQFIANVEILIDADSEGEASYKLDSGLIKGQLKFNIKNIEEEKNI
jgi:hypothetical protein